MQCSISPSDTIVTPHPQPHHIPPSGIDIRRRAPPSLQPLPTSIPTSTGTTQPTCSRPHVPRRPPVPTDRRRIMLLHRLLDRMLQHCHVHRRQSVPLREVTGHHGGKLHLQHLQCLPGHAPSLEVNLEQYVDEAGSVRGCLSDGLRVAGQGLAPACTETRPLFPGQDDHPDAMPRSTS